MTSFRAHKLSRNELLYLYAMVADRGRIGLLDRTRNVALRSTFKPLLEDWLLGVNLSADAAEREQHQRWQRHRRVCQYVCAGWAWFHFRPNAKCPTVGSLSS